MKIIMGIDQSFTSTGYFITRDGHETECGIIQTTKEFDMFSRATIISKKILLLIQCFGVNEVHIEGLAFGARGNVVRDLGGLLYSVINTVRHEAMIDNIMLIPPTTLKKYARTQKGLPVSHKMKKKDMFNCLPDYISTLLKEEKKFKITKGLYDVVDAYWLAKYVEEKGKENGNLYI